MTSSIYVIRHRVSGRYLGVRKIGNAEFKSEMVKDIRKAKCFSTRAVAQSVIDTSNASWNNGLEVAVILATNGINSLRTLSRAAASQFGRQTT